MTTLPIEPHLFWGLVFVGGVVLGSLLAIAAFRPLRRDSKDPLTPLIDALGLSGVNQAVFLNFAFLWAAIFLALYAGLLWLIWDVIWAVLPTDPSDLNEAQSDWRFTLTKLAALTAVLGAVVAFPLTLIRIKLNREQIRHNDLVLQNERIQSALSLMSAQTMEKRLGRTVRYSRDGRTGAEQQWYDEDHSISDTWTDPEIPDWRTVEASKPDLQQRLAGIRQLAAVVEEDDFRDSRSTDTSQERRKPSLRRIVNEHLANYIRTNAGRPTVEVEAILRLDWDAAKDNEVKDALPRGISTPQRLPRADVQAALSIIAQSYELEHTDKLDLRGIDIQNSDLQDAQLPGVNLQASQLNRTNLRKADLDGALLRGAELMATRMQGCSLRNAKLDGALFVGTRLQGADLSESKFNYTNFVQSYLNGACFFGEVPSTAFDYAPRRLVGASIRDVDLSGVEISQKHLDAIFYDGSVTLDANVERRTGSDEVLSESKFKIRWRAWQKEIGFDPDNPGD